MASLNFAQYPQQPHGGELVQRVVAPELREREIERARQLPAIWIDLEAVITVEMIATGVLSPNVGFMGEADYQSVLTRGRLSNGLVWPVPLSFAPVGERNAEVLGRLAVGNEVALVDHSGEPVAILAIDDLFSYDKAERARHLFGTTDRSHPGVDAIHRRMGEIALGGPLTMLRRADWGPFEKLRQEPTDTWRLFYEERGFRSVAGFITGANPLHRGHEYLHRNALEEVDGLFLQPLVEMAKREYVRHEYRMLAYRNVLDNYYPRQSAVLAPLRVTYIFAGPREAVLHALIMKNYGCTHALVGRDHAGIGSFYDKYASHSVFDEYTAEDLGIDVRLFHEVFFCTRCDSHASTETCPHDERYRLNISGTGIREMLRHGILPPREVVRPESARIAIQGIQPKGLDEQGRSTQPVGKVIQSMYPWYVGYSRLGGAPRPEPLDPAALTVRDLELATLDARSHSGQIYSDVYDEYLAQGDHNLALQPAWREAARESLRRGQQQVVADLEEKLAQAPEEASDEFMYQDRAEAERELEQARRQLEEIPPALDEQARQSRVWNPLPYRRYLGVDDDEPSR